MNIISILSIWLCIFLNVLSSEEGRGAFALSSSSLSPPSSSSSCSQNDGGDRDLASLLTWASKHSVQYSPSMTFSQGNNNEDEEDINNVGLIVNQPLQSSETILSVPRSIVLDSKRILHEWKQHDEESANLLEKAMDYITSYVDKKVLWQEDATFNFILMVKILHEYAKGTDSLWYVWLQSLPTTFDTGITMDTVEVDSLPPLALMLATHERQKFEIFQTALNILIDTNERSLEDNDTSLFSNLHSLGTEVQSWAFNIVQSRHCTTGVSKQPIIIPMGDLFNHKEPANVFIDDGSSSKTIHFKLISDVTPIHSIPSSSELYISYGLKNAHSFLICFGFVDITMPEIFCEIVFQNPSQELEELGCNDLSRMVYGTKDGTISDTVWDTVLYSILDQVPNDQASFYNAHVSNDEDQKKSIHDKYIMETCLSLRKHVMKNLKEVEALLIQMDEVIASYPSFDKLSKDHPRFGMIRQHNIFLYQTFGKIRHRIDTQAKAELQRRKSAV